MAGFHVDFSHGRELLGAGSVQDLQHHLPAIDFNLLSIAVFYGRIISLNPDILDELCSETALAYPTRSENDNVIFPLMSTARHVKKHKTHRQMSAAAKATMKAQELVPSPRRVVCVCKRRDTLGTDNSSSCVRRSRAVFGGFFFNHEREKRRRGTSRKRQAAW